MFGCQDTVLARQLASSGASYARLERYSNQGFLFSAGNTPANGPCYTAAPAHGQAEEGTLYEADSWSAIGAFLFGPDPAKSLTPSSGHANTDGKGSIQVGLISVLPCLHWLSHAVFSRDALSGSEGLGDGKRGEGSA